MVKSRIWMEARSNCSRAPAQKASVFDWQKPFMEVSLSEYISRLSKSTEGRNHRAGSVQSFGQRDHVPVQPGHPDAYADGADGRRHAQLGRSAAIERSAARKHHGQHR